MTFHITLLDTPKVAEFGFYWWEKLFGIDIKDTQVIEECILFGFSFYNDVMYVLNFCILYAKYYIYIQCLFNNNTLDLYACLTQLQQALKVEENICIKDNIEEIFFKFHFIHEKLQTNNENNTCNHVYMNMCKPPVIIWKYSKSIILFTNNTK